MLGAVCVGVGFGVDAIVVTCRDTIAWVIRAVRAQGCGMASNQQLRQRLGLAEVLQDIRDCCCSSRRRLLLLDVGGAAVDVAPGGAMFLSSTGGAATCC